MIKAQNLAVDAYRKIKLLMLQRKISPGQKLLYRELIDWLGMSKTPIINALNRLEQDGFIVSETNRGFYIKPMELKEIEDSYQVREALETKAIELVIQNGTQADLNAMEEKARAYDALRNYKYDNKMMLNAQFHIQVAMASGNQVLKYLLRQNLEHVILRLHLDSFPIERIAESSREHEALLKAIDAKDMVKSAELMRDHLSHSRHHIIAGISRHEMDSQASLAFFENERLP